MIEGGRWRVERREDKGTTTPTPHFLPSKIRKGVDMKRRGKTNRLKAALKRKNVKSSLRKSKGERKFPT
jgi:hypothetical protein